MSARHEMRAAVGQWERRAPVVPRDRNHTPGMVNGVRVKSDHERGIEDFGMSRLPEKNASAEYLRGYAEHRNNAIAFVCALEAPLQ